ncbi:hypothetical protein F511_39106 [Dorcoceras hygrometricum]|uniref:Uncharacterized protein n=1 Tax=Dorcoceras hygrometricum TaxID=472368 RepID=A0A2Z7BBS2_9LAMI|nr:hypothetical protein F511_39106 [Dorcoceras hygrometricum]
MSLFDLQDVCMPIGSIATLDLPMVVDLIGIYGLKGPYSAKEEQLLKWTKTDSLQTAVQRRLFITAKYREMLLHKFLEARHQNLVSGTPTSEIDLQVLDMLSEAHRIALIKFLEQPRLRKLKWTWPSSSILFGEADLSSDSSTSTSSTSSSDSHINFVDDLPQIDMPTVTFPTTNFTESTAQLRASIDNIQFEQDGITTIRAQLSEIIAYIEGVMTKRRKIVVVVRSLKIEADREVVEAAVNHLRKEVDHTKEEGAEVLDLVVGFLE